MLISCRKKRAFFAEAFLLQKLQEEKSFFAVKIPLPLLRPPLPRPSRLAGGVGHSGEGRRGSSKPPPLPPYPPLLFPSPPLERGVGGLPTPIMTPPPPPA